MIKKTTARRKTSKKNFSKTPQKKKVVAFKKGRTAKVAMQKTDTTKTALPKKVIKKIAAGIKAKDKKTNDKQAVSVSKKPSRSSATKIVKLKKERKIKVSQQQREESHVADSLFPLQETGGSPIPETIIQSDTASGGPPRGIPYKNEEYVSTVALNKDARTALGLRKPRGTSTHTFTAANHSRRSK